MYSKAGANLFTGVIPVKLMVLCMLRSQGHIARSVTVTLQSTDDLGDHWTFPLPVSSLTCRYLTDSGRLINFCCQEWQQEAAFTKALKPGISELSKSSKSWKERTFMTLKRTSWPRLSFSLKNSCSGYVRAMSLRINFSQGEVIFSSSEYWSFMGRFWALHRSCHTIARKWCGMPFLTSSCTEVWHKDSYVTMPTTARRHPSFCKQQMTTNERESKMMSHFISFVLSICNIKMMLGETSLKL